MSVRVARIVGAFLAAAALLLPITLDATAVQPVPASPRVSAGGTHACAITSAGGVKCWGYNDRGQLGDGSNLVRTSPVQVVGLTAGVTAIAASHGSFTCALTSAGGVKCWGFNQFGQLGNGSTNDSHTPVAVTGLTSGVSAIAVGDAHACALTTTGGVKCWGSAYLTFANNGWQNNLTPVDVPAFSGGVTAIATGVRFTCVLTTAGGVKCWGDNHDGELGNGDNRPTNLGSGTPVDVTGLTSGVVAIASQWAQTCALTSGGGVKCWGQNSYGELGNGATGFSRTPVDVSGLTSGVTAIATGSHESCAVTSTGGVKCWGSNLYAALGDPTIDLSPTPIAVSGLASGVKDVTVGQYFACALMLAGGVKCWGNDGEGELGNGDNHVAGYGAAGCPPKIWCVRPVDVIGLAGAPTASPAALSFRQSVPTPAEIRFNPKIVAKSLGIAAGIVVLVPFPGMLFNSTLEANYAEVVRRVRRARRRAKQGLQSLFKLLWMKPRNGLQRSSAPSAAATSPSNLAAASIAEKVDSNHEQLNEGRFWKTPLGVIVFLLLSALMFALLDPTFGPNRKSLSTFEGITAGLVVTLLAFSIPIALAYRRNAISFSMKALPGTLAIGLACVLISRLTHFQPGYLYGLIVTFAVAGELSVALEGRATAIAATTALVVAVVAWFGDWWVVSLTAAQSNPSPKLIFLQTTLVMVMVAGIELTAFGMLPLRFLPGEKVFRWNRRYWAGLSLIGMFGFVHVLMNPKNGYLADSTRTPIMTMVVLLLFFGLGSVVFWAYFRFRRIRVSPSVAS
jgi:alpha-tubulin suppressor-like RCC1 family protein